MKTRTFTPKANNLCRFIVLFALFALVSAANAVPIIFSGADPNANSTDPRPNSNAAAAAFDAAALALGTNSIITFESAPVGPFSSLVIAPGVTLTGTNGGGGNQEIRNSPFSTPDRLFGYNTTAGGSQFASIFGGTLTFTFSTPIDTFGAYLSGVQANGEIITFSDGSTQTIPIPNPGATGGVEFFGFTDAGFQISSITINANTDSNQGDIIGVDDVRFGRPAGSSVPDAGGSVLLLSLGIVGLVGVQRALGVRQRI
jgi:hypothetical protein